MPYADNYGFIRPMRRHIHSRQNFSWRITQILFQCAWSGADAEQKRDLLHQAQHGVLSVVSRRAEVAALYALKLAAHNIIGIQLFIRKAERHLMEPANVFAGYFFKGSGDNRLCQNVIEYAGIVDVLRALTDPEYGRFLRQMAFGEQAVPGFIRRNGAAVVFVAVRRQDLCVFLFAFFVCEHLVTPGEHVD